MHNGYCTCGTLLTIISNGDIQQWVCSNKDCRNYNRIVYRPYKQCEIYQTYEEAQEASRISKGVK